MTTLERVGRIICVASAKHGKRRMGTYSLDVDSGYADERFTNKVDDASTA